MGDADISVATLATTVAAVKRELEQLDDAIRNELLTTASLKQQASTSLEEQDRLKTLIEQSQKELLQLRAEQADVEAVLSSQRIHQGRLKDVSTSLKVGSCCF